MNRVLCIAVALGATLVGAVGASPTGDLRGTELVVGTGAQGGGVYYPAGRAICRVVERSVPGLSCQALPTAGSLYNLVNVQNGALDLGVVQSDWQYHAVRGTGPFEFADQDFGKLRAVFSLHSEAFTVMARRDAGIRRFGDLRGRRVNIGNPGSGQRATMEVVMADRGWDTSDFLLAEELPADQQSMALCHGRLEAMVYTVGHPNSSVRKAAGLCDAVLVEVAGPWVERLVARNPYYAVTAIPGGMYRGNPDPVRTFGVKATVVSSTEVSAEVIYAFVKAVFEDLGRLRRVLGAFGQLEPQEMATQGLSAPVHEGALRYYREQGLR